MARGDDVNAHRIGRQADAAILEPLPLVGERKAGVAVERLSIATLIVEFTGDRGVAREQASGGQRKDNRHHRRAPPLPSPGRDDEEREEQERMRRLRERRCAEERCCQVISASSAQPAGACGTLGGGLLQRPQAERTEHQRNVQELGRQGNEIDRHDGRAEEDDGVGQGESRARPARAQEGVGGQNVERHQHRVQHQEPVGAEGADERRGNQGIEVGFAVIKTVRPRIRRPHHASVGKAPDALQIDGLPPLEEDAFRCGKLLPDPDQIPTLEGEIEVPGEAVPEAVIGRLVSLKSQLRLRQIHGEGEAGQDQENGDEGSGGGREGRPAPGDAVRHLGSPIASRRFQNIS